MADEPEKEGKKPSIRAVLKDFSDKTTAHGIGQIYYASNWLWRILWLLCFGAGLIIVLIQCVSLIETYLSKPLQTTIDVKYSQSVSFPMVTICNLNAIRKSRLRSFPEMRHTFIKYEAAKDSNHTMNSSEFVNTEMRNTIKNRISTKDHRGSAPLLSDVQMDSTAYVQDEMLSILASDSREKVMAAGHSFQELVFRCSWLGFVCNKGDFLNYWRQTWNWKYGNCYTFNSGYSENGSQVPILMISKPGAMFGLELDLFINQAEYVSVLSQEAGVKVLLTDQAKIPFPATHGFSVSPGLSTSVGVRKFIIKRADPFKNTSCYSDETMEKDSIYKSIKGSVYSVQACMNSCLAKKQNMTCNCTEGKFRIEDTQVCRGYTQVACVLDINKAYENDSLGCSDSCPPPCEHKSYRYVVASAQWSEAYENDFQRSISKSGKGFDKRMGSDASMMRKNFLRIKLFFDELNLETINYSESYQAENLLGDIGGQLGLFIGVSVITLVELLKFCFDLICCLIKKTQLHLHKKSYVDDIHMESGTRLS